MELGPLVFKPKLSPKIWGGQRLGRYGKEFPGGQAIGESWDVYDRPGDSALVSGGPFAGQSLSALMAEFGPRLLGAEAFEQGPKFFPLMVKLIDANESLSVQVHPDDAQAARMVSADELGKAEMWVVLEAAPGATLVAGLRPGATREAFLGALKSGRLEEILNAFPVKSGDVVYVPAGRVHAIGKGCLVAEIQQNSDATWRIHDYGRLENGKPRDLHLSQAMECIRFDQAMQAMPSLVEPRRLSEAEELLIESPYFRVSRLSPQGQFKPALSPPSFHLLTAIKGAIKVLAGNEPLELAQGSTALLPALLSWSVEASQLGSQALWSRP
jgi:mannose-6-phosphate isomerase